MSQKHKAVETLEDLRGRCIIRDGCECWHWRLSGGGRRDAGSGHKMWFRGQTRTVPQVAYELGRGKPVPDGKYAYRGCLSADCANPAHIRVGGRRDSAKAASRRGAYAAQAICAVETARRRAKLTPELRCWLAESPQHAEDAAHALGISRSAAYKYRQAMQRIGSPLALAWR